jgi:lysophospholipase L1-like esterase
MQFRPFTVLLVLWALTSVDAAGPGFSFANIQTRSGFSALLEKGRSGGEIHVAFLGGSITENSRGHSGMVTKLLQARLPQAKIVAHNAGISSTCSTTGAFRLADQVLGQGPLDLLVVEFAVNDDQDAGHSKRDCIRGMEGIIRHVRRASPPTEIVMVYFVNEGIMQTIQDGGTPLTIGAHEQVAKHYGISSVNVARDVALAIKSGKYTWKDYGGVHPKPFGYEIASEMIVAAIAGGWDSSNLTGRSPLPPMIDADSYADGRFVSVKDATRNGEWRLGKVSRELLPAGSIRRTYESYDLLRGDRPGDALKLKFSGRSIGAFILAGPDAGMVTTRVDGGTAATHDLFHHHSGKLNYPRSVMFATGLAPGEHELDLTISTGHNATSSGTSASILYFEVN